MKSSHPGLRSADEGVFECGMGYRSSERRNSLQNEIEAVQSRLRSSDED